MDSYSSSIPDTIKLSFYEYQRKEWEKVLQTSANSRREEDELESKKHWENVGKYAQERIEEIDKQLQQLRLNIMTVTPR